MLCNIQKCSVTHMGKSKAKFKNEMRESLWKCQSLRGGDGPRSYHAQQFEGIKTVHGSAKYTKRTLEYSSKPHSLLPLHSSFFHSKLKTLLFNKSYPIYLLPHICFFPVTALNTIHHQWRIRGEIRPWPSSSFAIDFGPTPKK